jgi:mRNA interferase HicA
MRYREVAKKLSSLGCREVPRTGDGSHRKWLNPANDDLTVVPDRGGDDLKLGTIRAAVRQLGLSWEAFGRNFNPDPSDSSAQALQRLTRSRIDCYQDPNYHPDFGMLSAERTERRRRFDVRKNGRSESFEPGFGPARLIDLRNCNVPVVSGLDRSVLLSAN